MLKTPRPIISKNILYKTNIKIFIIKIKHNSKEHYLDYFINRIIRPNYRTRLRTMFSYLQNSIEQKYNLQKSPRIGQIRVDGFHNFNVLSELYLNCVKQLINEEIKEYMIINKQNKEEKR